MRLPVFIQPCGLFSRAAWLLLFQGLALLFAFAASFADELPYSESLVNEAVSRRLFEKREWRALLHYKPSVFNRLRSLIDDPVFFTSKDGKTDPRKEMEETVRSFFRTDVSGDAHPQCRFIGRFEWLSRELNIKKELLPQEDCKGYKELVDVLKPASAVLVFPVSHMNSPASMFGHTFLRIDSPSESKLFSYAVNYSASTDETNGILFAFRGIFGFYNGYYSILPYYEKIKEYNNLENRDIWEYKLNLTVEEVKRMVRHIWELKDTYSYYYFFDENCSYNLLLLLEAARPEVNLTEGLPGWVIPMDTVKAIEDARMMEEEAGYRPSRATRIRYIESITGVDAQDMAEKIAKNETDPAGVSDSAAIEREERIRTLDLSAEYMQYLYAKKRLAKDDYMKRYLKVLSARSKLGLGEEYRIPHGVAPEKGHGTSRVYAGAGVKRGSAYQTLGVRPANHDLSDPIDGYLPGAAISFLDTELRYNYTERKFSLEKLTLVEIVSISEIDRFFKPVSWKVATGVYREEYARRRHRTVFDLNGGPGASVRVLSDGLLYAFLEPDIKIGSGLDKGYSIGAGLSAGILKQITGRWGAELKLRAVTYAAGDKTSVVSGELNQRFTINRTTALKLSVKREKYSGFYSTDVAASWNLYF
ncbi:MAG: DUF4105 domain-containing protein [Deltaproteobacteria bacterium]|nr:DUF4105 domain-containing protein [Deltaproteobacteria bacterium]